MNLLKEKNQKTQSVSYNSQLMIKKLKIWDN